MRVFNEEDNDREVFIVLSVNESQRIIDMMGFAADNNKRKKSWQTIRKTFEEKLLVY